MAPYLQRIDYILKHNRFIYSTYRCVFSLLFRFIGLFIRQDDKMILFSGLGKRFNDSPKAIYLYLVEKGLDKEYNCVWAIDDPEKYDIPGKHDVVITDSLKYFITSLKAKYWCCCVNIERGLHFKKKQTRFLHTWHGASINLCGNAVGFRKDFDFTDVDFMCISGEYERGFVIRDFNVRDESIILTGLPRNDRLYATTPKEIEAIRDNLDIPASKKVILYAPTWRDSQDGGQHYSLVPPIDWEKWADALRNDYVVLVRTHPNTTERMNVKFGECIRDFSNYPDINDLLLVADFLISDYSSTIMDYCILDRPIICFGYDYEEYNKNRGFYFDLKESLPSGVKETEDEVLDYILNSDYNLECEKTKAFHQAHIEAGGNATVSCVNRLLGL